MPLALYLAALDGNGAPLLGAGPSRGLKNPFRAGAAVNRPLVVTSFDLGGVAPPPSQTGPSAKVDLTELVVVLPDDSATPSLFRLLCTGSRYRTVDVLAVTTDATPRVVSGVGLGPATTVSSFDRTVTADGVLLKIGFDAQQFSVGSAPLKPDGTYSPFTFVTYDVKTGSITG